MTGFWEQVSQSASLWNPLLSNSLGICTDIFFRRHGWVGEIKLAEEGNVIRSSDVIWVEDQEIRKAVRKNPNIVREAEKIWKRVKKITQEYC